MGLVEHIPFVGRFLASPKKKEGTELGFVVPARAKLTGGGKRAGAGGSVAIFHDTRWEGDPLVELTTAQVGVRDAEIGIEITGFAVMDGADDAHYESTTLNVKGRIFDYDGSASSGKPPKQKKRK